MKELSIEEKAKAYDEAIKRASKLRVQNPFDTVSQMMEHVFPELKESEDEKIRKEILEVAETVVSCDGTLYGKKYNCREWIAWLEKQGEQKVPIIDFKAKNWYVSKVDGQIHDMTYNPADMVEPKFKVGDWIVDNIGVAHQIEKTVLNVTNNTFGYDIVGGGYFNDDSDVHLWTIQDAKDGDVLCAKYGNDEMPFIFTGKQGDVAYCALNSFGEFVLSIAEWLLKISVLPATKEQRDLLFTKMKEAGFEWDAEKKELKNIDDEEVNGEDYGIDGLWHAQRILEKTLGKVEGYQTDDGILGHKAAITAVKKLYEQKPAWSEEDEHRINRISDFIWKNRKGDTDEIYQQEKDADWIKSLKNKVQPQPKQEWSEEDEKRLKSCLNILQPKTLLGNTETINTKWLKSLKQRHTWKPSDEQMNALDSTLQYSQVSYNSYEHLNSLYNDLKKLTE